MLSERIVRTQTKQNVGVCVYVTLETPQAYRYRNIYIEHFTKHIDTVLQVSNL